MENLNERVNHKNVSCENIRVPNIEAYFDNLEDALIEKINKHKNGFIFGCVAWLTSEPILNALATCKNVQILVQKEDFLRPDSDSKTHWNKKLQKLYGNLSFEYERHMLKDPIGELSFASDPTVHPVMCVGNHNKEKHPAFPRSHHKFLVFCDYTENENKFDFNYWPIAVWTGSFNFTKNATHSFENALYIEDKSGNNPILQAYLNEHHQIFTLSEMLDWETTWIEPRYRIGT
jgi:hypothetical protein